MGPRIFWKQPETVSICSLILNRTNLWTRRIYLLGIQETAVCILIQYQPTLIDMGQDSFWLVMQCECNACWWLKHGSQTAS